MGECNLGSARRGARVGVRMWWWMEEGEGWDATGPQSVRRGRHEDKETTKTKPRRDDEPEKVTRGRDDGEYNEAPTSHHTLLQHTTANSPPIYIGVPVGKARTRKN